MSDRQSTMPGPQRALGETRPTSDTREGDDDDPETQAMIGRLTEQLFGATHEPVRIGRFALLDMIGSGAMGVVHLGYDDVLDRKVAIKLIRHERTTSPDAHARLLREAQAMARVSHANVVPVYEAGEYPGGLFIAMEFVEGKTLRLWLQEERPWQETLEVLLGAGRGLAAAHEQGIVHRDFKPDNVLITTRNEAKVGDFGLAGLGKSELLEISEADENLGLTQTGSLIGTPMYMSPEQFDAELATDRSDQFAFCVVATEALYGQRPFEGDTVASLSYNIASGRTRPVPRTSLVPGHVRDAVARGLALDPAQRWPSMEALLSALQPRPRQRRGWIVGGLAAAVAVVIGAQAIAGDSDAPCGGARTHLDGVWDDARKDALGRAYEAVDTTFAADVWARTAPQITTYAEAWVQMHTRTCEMTRVHEEQSAAVMDLRMMCLGRARKRLVASIDVLAQPDDDVLTNAHRLVGELPALSRCADVEVLQREGDPPSAEEASAVDQIETWVAASEALVIGGRYDDALREAEQAAAALAEIEYGPVATEVWGALGNVQLQRQQHDAAEQALRQAQQSATQHGQWKRAVEASALLGFTVGARGQRFAEAHWVIDLARGLALRTGDPALLASLRSREASVLASEGRFAEAVAAYREANRPKARRNVAIALLRWGKVSEAEVEIRGALSEMIERLGPEHPKVAQTYYTLGTIQKRNGQLAEAAASLDKAIALAEQSIPGNPEIANFRQTAVSMLVDEGRIEEAVEGFRVLLGEWEPVLGPDATTIQAIRGNLAVALMSRGHYAEATALMRLVLESRIRRLGADHPLAISTRGNLGATLLSQKDHTGADRELRLALEAGERVYGADNVKLATILGNLGNSKADQHDYAQAVAYYERALALQLEAFGPDHLEIAARRNNLGTVSLEQGRFDTANEHFSDALRIWEATLPASHPSIGMALLNLGRVELARGACGRGVPWLERSMKIYEGGEAAPVDLATAMFVLAACLWEGDTDRPRAATLARQSAALFRTLPVAVGGPNLAEVEKFLRDKQIPAKP